MPARFGYQGTRKHKKKSFESILYGSKRLEKQLVSFFVSREDTHLIDTLEEIEREYSSSCVIADKHLSLLYYYLHTLQQAEEKRGSLHRFSDYHHLLERLTSNMVHFRSLTNIGPISYANFLISFLILNCSSNMRTSRSLLPRSQQLLLNESQILHRPHATIDAHPYNNSYWCPSIRHLTKSTTSLSPKDSMAQLISCKTIRKIL
ncbi:hypothetical protein HAX54_007097 [Datura stramonium]|uniref:Uncharacterized protein n=1 Tax=Datura stramonium TaxID=4076 RepID=A0ABS8WWK6_DATST|nr:hypothetical protein [Datura stramonium]